MASITVLVTDPAGMHARPASKVAHLAASFDQDIHITYKGRTIDAKSIMGLMSLGVPKGAEMTISVTGDDDESVVAQVKEEMKNLGLIND
jgi:phosphocarrier protein